MAPKKKKKSTAAGGGAAAVKAKKKGSKKKAGPSTLRVLLGTNESIIKIEVSDELTARCAHVLAKHVECAGNVSRRTGDESALTAAPLARRSARRRDADDPVAAFFAAAATRSDCASASQGDLGNRGGRMSKDFEAAIFALHHARLGRRRHGGRAHLIMRLPLEEAAPAR
ncbi:hypothetical protein JL721_12944 [Aureococcus anophagefferens]|nr:hypothetical protein JL721_12944 [Aureococcus anophagefferens]